MKILCVVVLISLLHATTAVPSCKNSNQCGVIATWFPNSWDSSSYSQMQAAFQQLKNIGICRVYVDVWNNGIVYFNSPTMQSTVGSAGVGADHLSWAIEIGHGLDMEVYAWFEYGLMSGYAPGPTTFGTYAINNGWTIGTYNNFVWMDPTNNDVVNFMNGILKDAISSSYSNIDGFQLDDHYAYPQSLSSHSPSDSTSIMTNLTSFLRTNTHHTNPSAAFSLSPNPLSVSTSTYNVDWNLYGDKGYYDEVVPQLYRSSYSDYNSVFHQTIASTSAATQNLMDATGLRIDGTGASTSWDDLKLMMNENRAYSIGFSFWYARGVQETYPSQITGYLNTDCY